MGPGSAGVRGLTPPVPQPRRAGRCPRHRAPPRRLGSEDRAGLRKERSARRPPPSSRGSHQSERTNPGFGGGGSAGGSRPGAALGRAGHARHGSEEDPALVLRARPFLVRVPRAARHSLQHGLSLDKAPKADHSTCTLLFCSLPALPAPWGGKEG